MAWQGNYNGRLVMSPFLAATIGFLAIALFVFWSFKIQNIRAIKREIAQLETKLATGQKLWRQFPPLGPEEKRELQEAQKRLIRKLPEDKDLPSLFEEVSRLAQDHNLLDVSFKTGDTAGPSGKASVVAATTAIPKVNAVDDSKAVGSFPIQVSFSGDYKEIAYFLEALKDLPRLVRIQSLLLQRDVPLVRAEVALQAYYKKGDMLAIGK